MDLPIKKKKRRNSRANSPFSFVFRDLSLQARSYLPRACTHDGHRHFLGAVGHGCVEDDLRVPFNPLLKAYIYALTSPYTQKAYIYALIRLSMYTNAVNIRPLRFSYCNTVTVLN